MQNEQMQQDTNAQGHLINKQTQELEAQSDPLKKQQQQWIGSLDLKMLNQENQLMEQSVKIEQILRSEKLSCGMAFNKLFIIGAIASGIVVFLKK